MLSARMKHRTGHLIKTNDAGEIVMARKDYLGQLRAGKELTRGQQLSMILSLSIPAILAQISSVIMQYIDASMVGQLGANASASIGLVASTTWLIGNVCQAMAIGFTVQVAQQIGAGRNDLARSAVRHGLLFILLLAAVLSAGCVVLSGQLPGMLGGAADIRHDATRYFRVYAFAIPALAMNYAASGMLGASGNMKVPSMLNILMCFLDVVFNFLFIFPTREIQIGTTAFTMPGAGLHVTGAALGTAMAEVVCTLIMLLILLFRSPMLRLRREKAAGSLKQELRTAGKISLPVGFEALVMGMGYVMYTKIIAPLGTVAIAANSFAATAESVCYMPAFGISQAATTIIGQTVGAGRKDMNVRLSRLIVGLGMVIMLGCSSLLFLFAPQMIGMLSPDPEIRALGTALLRIIAFEEPFYAAAVVTNGVFRGRGDTLVPSIMTLISMWGVRIPASAWCAVHFGLKGSWAAVGLELVFRGVIFLVRLRRRNKRI